MLITPVIAIFDIGKTNKKLFLLDEEYRIVLERTAKFDEVVDEDGDACEDVEVLSAWIRHSLAEVLQLKEFTTRAVNFSAYGASIVNIDIRGKVVTPLYNYLKPFPKELDAQFVKKYGDRTLISRETASPVLGNLNSGMQLYRIKYQRPELYKKIKYALHLPQYISYLITGQAYSDITSVGCHTQLWNFQISHYHQWASREKLTEKLAPLYASDKVLRVIIEGKEMVAGIGLHDSSAALIPYLESFSEPFILISTGTWCISLNPFNQQPLTNEELSNDCLCYIGYKGKPVKASRLFAGHEHELEVKRLARHFNKPVDAYKKVKYQPRIITQLQLQEHADNIHQEPGMVKRSAFSERKLSSFKTYDQAYHCLIADIMRQQKISTALVMKGTQVKRIFVDGGFSNNPIYMYLLAAAFPETEVFAASVAQASAVGAALAIHSHWNTLNLPGGLIEMKYYSSYSHSNR